MPLGKRHLYSSSALKASVCSPAGVYSNKPGTAYYSFVFQILEELPPASIRDMFSKMMISKHVLDVKIFNRYKRKGFYNPFRKFMNEIISLVGYFKMLSRQFYSLLVSVVGTFLCSAQSTIQSLQSLFSMNKKSWIVHNFLFIGPKVVSQPYIKPNMVWRRISDVRNINFAAKASKPLVSFILLDGQSLDFSFRDSMQDDWQTANLGNVKSCTGNKLEGASVILRISYALYSALKSWIAGFNPYAFLAKLNSVKEVIKRFTKPVRNILKDLAVCLVVVFRAGGFNVFDKAVKVWLGSCPKRFVQAKQSVIDFLADFKLINNPYLLLSRRINSVFECSLLDNHIIYWYTQLLYKPYVQMSSGYLQYGK